MRVGALVLSLTAVCAILLLPAQSSAQGSVLLVGGGSENYNDWSDAPYAWLVQRASNKKILILHYSTVSTFLPDYFTSLGAAEAVSAVIGSAAAANDSLAYRMILQYDGIFLRGGDQWQYVTRWRGTLAEQAIREVYARGGIIGGTSAGAMVLSGIISDARLASVDPRTALRAPLNASITFTDDFLGFISGIICDTHFFERGRIGRLLAMMALHHRSTGEWVNGLGIDDATACGILPDGTAEVFGSGVVSFLSVTETSKYRLEPFTPLGFSNVRLRQLTKKYTFNIHTGDIVTMPASAKPFVPDPFSMASAQVLLHGGTAFSGWSASEGILERFSLLLSSHDTVTIITGSPSSSAVQSLAAFFTSQSFAYRIIPATPFDRNREEYAQAFLSAHRSLVVELPIDSAAVLTDTSGLSAQYFRSAAVSGAIMFLGDATMLAGNEAIGQTEHSTTAAYRGRLTRHPGTKFLRGVVTMPRSYEESDYVENRTSGLFWGMGVAQTPVGLLLDTDSYAVISDNGLGRFYGTSPSVVAAVYESTAVDFPVYRASNSVGPRQNASFADATVHVLSDTDIFDFTSAVGILSADERSDRQQFPSSVTLHQNFPNPFNPVTTISFSIPPTVGFRSVSLRVFDLLGREIAVLFNGGMNAEMHTVTFEASHLATGIYFYRLQAGNSIAVKKMLLLK